jgi:tetratricopeptide (TPR) repeat protein
MSSRNLKLLFIPICFLALAVPPALAETWVKVVTPHFTVISNGSEKDARTVARNFERFRAALLVLYPSLRVDASAQIIVVAPKDVQTFDKLLPYEKKEDRQIGGLFRPGWEHNYVIVRLDFPDQAEWIVYHEYVHNVLHLNFTRMPTWLDEGLSDFYASTRFEGDKVYIGAPSPRLAGLQDGTPYPLKTLLAVNERSPYYHDQDKVGMFYAESWGLTHYLEFGEGMGNGQRLNTYLSLLQKKTDPMQAFQETFGNLDQVDKSFRQYISKYLFTAVELRNPPKIDMESFQGGPMSVGETDAELGGFFNYMGSADTAYKWLSDALAADPKSALAHQNMAFYAFRKGDDDTARKEFDQAVALDPTSYLAVYYRAMMKYGAKIDDDSLKNLDAAMTRVLQLNPMFAPALIVRSQVLIQQGQLQAAYNAAAQAWNLEPDRAGYLTHLAAILSRGRNYPEAIKDADAVISRWSATDGAEAIAVADHARRLGNIEETPEEKAAEADELKYAAGLLTINGIVSSVTCEPAKPVRVVLSALHGDIQFELKGPFGEGFSDTLWYGEDHFSLCHHLEGMPAVIRYTKTNDATPINVIRWLEIRDQLIPMVPIPEGTVTAN